ncbi:Thioester reductase domain-containing protein [Amycolatopsis marina]|uniref:Thioester reductase domain-containing protein n=1 Tax=Amycolatopsis marina TaxID=490629 RepID=A0A1I0V7P6_9PSEU|nr:SDR family oxidoreductase [Amycolatopsis marina]SFA72272.1 Thioester reductase domain-containing protein [Amycolatopsis marina]
MGSYFVTGGTGFLGRRLIRRLLSRPDCEAVYVLVREQSRHRLAELTEQWPHPDLVVPVIGDLTTDHLGVDPAGLRTPIDHVVHLGAVYDLTADTQLNEQANVTGTRNVLAFAARAQARWLHHVSSIAVAGEHEGRFTESDFDLGQRLPTSYHATKFAAEKLVREQSGTRYRVYRPAAVVGDSVTGEMDKVDGPYFFLPAFAKLGLLPSRLPLIAPRLGDSNIVPVDYVVDAMEHLMHIEAESGATYHLAAPRPQSLTEVHNAFSAAAGGPRIVATLPVDLSARLRRAGRALTRTGKRRTLPHRAIAAMIEEVGIPAEVLPVLSTPVEFDTTATRAALAGSGLRCPPLQKYAGRLYRYWAEHLDVDRARRGPAIRGRTVLVTGASAGIGRAVAVAVASEGATVLLVARRGEELEAVRAQITSTGGSAAVYPCDLTDAEAVDAMVKRILAEHGPVDMLVNNAGRSIRRSVALSTDRMHDYERTMALNYFAPLRLTFALLPPMIEQRFGHVVNVTTQGLQNHTPRFSAYLSSKAALDEFGKVAGRDLLAAGITFSSVRLPLVRTAMSAPSAKVYRRVRSLSAEQAAGLVVRALRTRREVLNLPAGTAAEFADRLAPRTMRTLTHLAAYQAMPETAPDTRSRQRRTHPVVAVLAAVTRLAWRPR